MRTKTLILAALLSAAGAATSLAQAVYSVNAVGYVNIAFTNAGFFIISNPLNNGNNQIGTIISNAPDSTIVYRFSPTGFSQPITFVAGPGGGWFSPTGPATDVLAPGEGFFLQIPTGSAPVTLTFIGEVPQGTSLVNPVTITANKFSLIASQVPVSAGLDQAIMGFTNAVDSDTVYFFDGSKQKYSDGISFVQGAGWFGPAGATNPTPKVAEGFFFFSGSAANRTWTRSFSVNTP